MIPQYYFEYLRGGSGQRLAGVVRHNQMDLRGLAALFGKINSFLTATEDSFPEADSLDLLGLSKFLHRKGEKELAHAACAYARDAGLPKEFRPQATRELALMAKRRGDRERAASLLRELVSNPVDTVFACEQLAMYYERYARELRRALEFAELGLKTLRRQIGRCRDPLAIARYARQAQKFVCRVERLRHRIRSADGSVAPLLARAATVDGSQVDAS
jgi:hypothetical protein